MHPNIGHRYKGRLVCSSLVHIELKFKFALVGLAALSLAAAGTASAMPLAPLSPASNVESVALVCGLNGCFARRPFTDGTATALVAMAMYVEVTDIVGSIAAGN